MALLDRWLTWLPPGYLFLALAALGWTVLAWLVLELVRVIW